MAGIEDIRSLLQAAGDHEDEGRREEAMPYLEEARRLALASKNREWLSEVENSYGNLYFRFGEFQKALSHRKRTVSLLGPKGHPWKLAVARTNLASCHLMHGEHDLAIKLLHQAIEFYTEGLPERSLLQHAKPEQLPFACHTLYTIANVHHHLKDLHTCMEYCRLILSLEEKYSLERDPDVLGLLASCNLDLDVKEAIRYAKAMIELSDEHGYALGSSMGYSGLATAAMQRGELSEARNYNAIALEKCLEARGYIRVSEIHCNLAEIEIAEGEYQRALDELSRADAAIAGIVADDLRERINRIGSKALEALGDYKTALEAFKRSIEFRDKVTGHDHQQEVARLRDAYRKKCDLKEKRVLSMRLKQLENDKPREQGRSIAPQILQIAPTLTKTEIKVCELLHRGSSTKEIAQEMNSSRHTIDGHRTSIRKKLNLSPVEDLVTYLIKATSQQNGLRV
jgi:tetratricopeptide (TPR) repeat protein